MAGTPSPATRGDEEAWCAALVTRVGAGDTRALEELYDRYARPAYALAKRVTGDPAFAEEVVQEVFLAVWRQPDKFQPGRGAFASWLLAAVHHKAVDAVRREEAVRRRADALFAETGPEGGAPPARTEDVLQDVFLSIWRDPAAFDGSRGSVASWLLTMVHHKAVDAVRREESHRRRTARAEEDLALSAPTQTSDVEDEAWERVEAGRVRTALRSLPDPQREALTLAYYGGYTQREVAALTETPLGTVKTRMLAGMRRLKLDLDGGTPPSGRADGTAR